MKDAINCCAAATSRSMQYTLHCTLDERFELSDILEALKYGFLQKALISGVFISILCAVLGVFLVLKRLSLIGDGLSHVTFFSVALGFLFHTTPLYISVPIVVISSLGILKLTEKGRVFGDTAIGIVSSVGIAGGILLASAAGGFNVDLFSYLFGNILTILLAISIGLDLRDFDSCIAILLLKSPWVISVGSCTTTLSNSTPISFTMVCKLLAIFSLTSIINI